MQAIFNHPKTNKENEMSRIMTSFHVTEEKPARLAVLIDADNASARDIGAILEEVVKFGDATVKRIYGNFVGQNGQWKQAINDFTIRPMQQFAFTTGKNSNYEIGRASCRERV